ncbi:hypothetical protein [Reichenbachiella sp. MALMAid0571]|uniref:hypothetical protein n=1 Tax=Reichenbachiella sp. MALMAid0571 TaxID=3143939 RepID=UPI0032DED11F
MECLSPKSEISNTFSAVREFSFREKKRTYDEERINLILDAILEFKSSLSEKTNKLNDLNENIEKLTWENDLDDECLMLLNDLISSAKDLHSSLIRQYVGMKEFRAKGIAKDEIKDFKNSIDDLKETYTDLESAFFFLPKMPEFIETTKEFALV